MSLGQNFTRKCDGKQFHGRSVGDMRHTDLAAAHSVLSAESEFIKSWPTILILGVTAILFIVISLKFHKK